MADALPSWHACAARDALLDFVARTTTPGSPDFLRPQDRIAVFDQDGTTWVEQPGYTQVAFAFHQVGVLAAANPALKDLEPFKTVLSGDAAAIAKLQLPDLLKIVGATHAGMTVEAFQHAVDAWIATAVHPRFDRPYTELVYQPMLEAMRHLEANGYKVFIVTGGGQDFVRVYVERIYGVPRDQVVGSSAGTAFAYNADGHATLTKGTDQMRIDDKTGKAVEIHQHIGRRPVMAFGNSDGDRQMLEYTQDGGGARFMLLVHHDDAAREYGSDALLSVFSDELMAEARQRDWVVVSMKNDWKRVFAWEAVA